MNNLQCAIIGAGSAGLAAAIELKKNGIDDIIIFEKNGEAGGILNQCIHNGFGLHEFKEELSGPAYAERFANQAKELNIKILFNTTVVAIHPDLSIEVSNEDGYQIYNPKAIVLAMGCSERTAGQIQIPGMRPVGVYTAGTAQRYVNLDGYKIGKKVFILGSGDIGLIMARRMSLEGAQVLGVAELMPYSNGLQRNIVQCLNDYDIPLYLSHTVTNIEGYPHLNKVTISKVDSTNKPIPGTEQSFEVDTLLLSVGLIPDNTLPIDAGMQIDSRTKGLKVNEFCQAQIPGIFACGNVLQVHDLVDYVTAEGRKAGQGAAKYLKSELDTPTKTIETAPGDGVGYVLPQRIDYPDTDKFVELSFRVRKPSKNSTILIKDGDKVIQEIKKDVLLPAEMEKVLLINKLLIDIKDKIVIEVKENA